MTSIYLAIKIHSTKKMSMQAIVSTGNGRVTAPQIERMELDIMQCLDWKLSPPTPLSFIANFVPLICVHLEDAEVERICAFFAELSVCMYLFNFVKPSSIAIASILCGLESLHLPDPEKVVSDFKAAVHKATGLDANARGVQCCKRILRELQLQATKKKKMF